MKKRGNSLFIVFIIIISLFFFVFFFYQKNESVKTEFIFQENTLDMKLNETARVSYTLNKELSIVWSSSNPLIVSVDNNGLLTSKMLGNAIITGKIEEDNIITTRSCLITVYDGDKNVSLKDISLPEGEVIMSIGNEFKLPITYEPKNAYISSINYYIEDSSIIVMDGDTIKTKKTGSTDLRIVINGTFKRTIHVNVVSEDIESQIVQLIKNIIFKEEKITLLPNESKKIEYSIQPFDAYIQDIKWSSSDNDIVEVNNGIVTAKKSGDAVITLSINNITATIPVSVNIPITDIQLNYQPKTILKVGERIILEPSILPENATTKKLLYTSTNLNVLSVNDKGEVTANAIGSADIKIQAADFNKTLVYSFNVLPKQGSLSGGNRVWGYVSNDDKIPRKADLTFFNNLVKAGKGTINGYTYSYKGYSYNIDTDCLTYNNQNVLMRFYYPDNTDLSKLNTFAFLGGSSEVNFGSYFKTIASDLSIIKSKGITILISYSSKIPFSTNGTINATNFVREIINQNKNARNAVGGYSMGGPYAADAANNGPYQKLLIFDSYFENVSTKNNLKNKEIIFYSPINDKLTWSTTYTLQQMKKNGYQNVIIVSNNSDIINQFSGYLTINPGSLLGSGHTSNNITKANFFAFACD